MKLHSIIKSWNLHEFSHFSLDLFVVQRGWGSPIANDDHVLIRELWNWRIWSRVPNQLAFQFFGFWTTRWTLRKPSAKWSMHANAPRRTEKELLLRRLRWIQGGNGLSSRTFYESFKMIAARTLTDRDPFDYQQKTSEYQHGEPTTQHF